MFYIFNTFNLSIEQNLLIASIILFALVLAKYRIRIRENRIYIRWTALASHATSLNSPVQWLKWVREWFPLGNTLSAPVTAGKTWLSCNITEKVTIIKIPKLLVSLPYRLWGGGGGGGGGGRRNWLFLEVAAPRLGDYVQQQPTSVQNSF